MRVLIACEFSGTVRDAFIARGHDAVSCDLLPTESPGPHIQGDVLPVLDREKWDLIIAHPPCTYLCHSGVRWLYKKGRRENGTDLERFQKMWDAVRFFNKFLLKFDCDKVAIENPVMHGFANIRPFDFSVQPWQFGHPECKRTCFWTRGLPPLKPTKIVEGRKQRSANESPGPDRWKRRSRTLPGIAEAMADQWTS